MTKDEMAEIFADRDEDRILAFENLVENKRSNRADLHAFLLLDSLEPLDPEDRNAVAAAGHDEIWLDFNDDTIAAAITREQVIELRRCGVMYENDGMGFHMFA